jgi:hypothetical protein
MEVAEAVHGKAIHIFQPKKRSLRTRTEPPGLVHEDWGLFRMRKHGPVNAPTWTLGCAMNARTPS